MRQRQRAVRRRRVQPQRVRRRARRTHCARRARRVRRARRLGSPGAFRALLFEDFSDGCRAPRLGCSVPIVSHLGRCVQPAPSLPLQPLRHLAGRVLASVMLCDEPQLVLERPGGLGCARRRDGVVVYRARTRLSTRRMQCPRRAHVPGDGRRCVRGRGASRVIPVGEWLRGMRGREEPVRVADGRQVETVNGRHVMACVHGRQMIARGNIGMHGRGGD